MAVLPGNIAAPSSERQSGGIQAFLRGFLRADLAGAAAGFFASDLIPASNRFHASGCSSIAASSDLGEGDFCFGMSNPSTTWQGKRIAITLFHRPRQICPAPKPPRQKAKDRPLRIGPSLLMGLDWCRRRDSQPCLRGFDPLRLHQIKTSAVSEGVPILLSRPPLDR